DLLTEHSILVQLTLLREREQLIVRDAAPEEERQARGEVEIAYPVRRAGGEPLRRRLDAEDKLRIGEQPLHERLDARIERAALPAEGVKLHQRRDIRGCFEASIGTARE